MIARHMILCGVVRPYSQHVTLCYIVYKSTIVLYCVQKVACYYKKGNKLLHYFAIAFTNKLFSDTFPDTMSLLIASSIPQYNGSVDNSFRDGSFTNQSGTNTVNLCMRFESYLFPSYTESQGTRLGFGCDNRVCEWKSVHESLSPSFHSDLWITYWMIWC